MTLDGIFKGEQRVVLFTIWPRNLLNLDIKDHLTFEEHLSVCSYRHCLTKLQHPDEVETVWQWGVSEITLEIGRLELKSQPGYFQLPDGNCFPSYLAGCCEDNIFYLLLPPCPEPEHTVWHLRGMHMSLKQ